MKKPVIEHENLELDRLIQEISQEGRKEKNAKVPLNDLFYWWTRKPLALSRASAILPIIEKQDQAKPFLKLDLEKRSYHYPIDISKLEEINPNLNSIKILDPFSGSGNLIFESARLGMDSHASDYNPLSYLILKGSLEYPKKYPTLSEDVKKYGEKLIENTKSDLSEYFDSKILAFVWLWCADCPHCGQNIPLTNNMWISRKQKLGFKIIPDKNLDCKFELMLFSCCCRLLSPNSKLLTRTSKLLTAVNNSKLKLEEVVSGSVVVSVDVSSVVASSVILSIS